MPSTTTMTSRRFTRTSTSPPRSWRRSPPDGAWAARTLPYLPRFGWLNGRRRGARKPEIGRRPDPGAESVPMIVVMGVDPGVASTGFGVVRVAGGRMSAVDGGVIEAPPGEPTEMRLARIHDELDRESGVYGK